MGISFLPGLYCYFLILQDDCITDSHIKVGLDLLPTSYVTFICDCLWSKEEEKEKESLARMYKNIFKIFLIILDAMDEALPLGYTYCCTELYSDTAEQGFITSKERTNAVIEKRINIME